MMLDKIKGFLNQPFSENMNVVGWFAFFGLILVIGIAWRIVLGHIARVA